MLISSYEREKWRNGFQFLVGADEAGRGAWAGPVIAAMVGIKDLRIAKILEQKFKLIKIQDSKSLSFHKRKEIFIWLEDNPMVVWSIGQASAKEIDRLNILQATFLAWRRAFQTLKKRFILPDFLFFDGPHTLPKLGVKQAAVVGGDKKVLTVALASIMAKVWRDQLMARMEKEYSYFSFAQHKGYGTKKHLEEISRFGPSKIHRISYRPVFQKASFQQRVYWIVSRIPRGEVKTYKMVAELAGSPRAWRAVGNILRKNYNSKIPCHRVIRSDGKIGNYNRGILAKRIKLQKEGAVIKVPEIKF